MGGLRQNAKRIGRGLRPLWGFEALYKMAAVILFVPLLAGVLALTMRISGYTYLTHENIGAFLSSPATLLAAAGLLTLAAVYGMVDVSAVVFALDQSVQGVQVTREQILRFALKNTARAWRSGSVLLIPATLALLPLVSVGFVTGFLTSVSIPRLVLNFLRARRTVPVLIAAAAVITFLGVRLRYAVFCFTVDGCGFAEARRRCAAAGRGNHLRDLALLLAVQILFSAVYVLLLLLVTALTGLLGRWVSDVFLLKWLAYSAVWLAIVLVLSVIAALAVPVGYGCVGILYYRRRAAAGLADSHIAANPAPGDPRLRARRRLLQAGLACAITAGSLTLGFLLSTGGINPDIEHLHTVEITAHRGASAFYPENTMAAFNGALELGADWVELDVQQCRDGRLVVTHDANLKRTTGVNANTWDLTYGEIAGLDAGSSFSPEYAGERIPLLEDVLSFARDNGMKLNIELKPTGHETGLEKAVADAIRAAELEDSCVVTSQAYSCLEALKAYDETIPTVYVMRFAYGGIDRLAAADSFSVEASSVTRALVSRVHNAGKSLYVWTVNTRKSITRMIELSVDNIITDNIDLAKQCVYESRYSVLLGDYVDLLQ